MKYFIDFEATQFSQEIISIGCIREDGQTFSSRKLSRVVTTTTEWVGGE